MTPLDHPDGGPDRPESAAYVHPWDGFLIGPENALAHAGVIALARGEDAGLSPLVLHGPPGSGKSRLLAGLVAERLARRPETVAAHVTAETFAASCSEAADRPGGWSELRSRFRALDLFVLEDVHALERAPLALEELTYTLDDLDARGAAVAVSARTAPGTWRGWPARLVSRLVGGLAVRVDPPGPSSRRRYVLARARAQKVPLSAEAAEALAASADGYRTLDGLLARLALDARLARRPVDRPAVEEALAEDGAVRKPATVEEITRAVAARFGLRPSDLRNASRRAALVEPRHLAIYLARELTGLSFAALGAAFGGRDTKTVRHACAATAARLAADPKLAAAAAAIASQVGRPDKPPQNGLSEPRA